jgi:tRNAThr (cytosine32-N3)-methyltransferase
VSEVEARARAAIEAAHAADPEREDGRAAEALYADHVEAWLPRLVEAPSLALRLAGRGQHLERWAIPRADFPEGRGGYLRWRSAVHQRQGERIRELLAAAGCDAALTERVAQLVAKGAPQGDAEAQALEDAACLVFLETELPVFQQQHERDKVVDVLRKTWRKMSPRGQQLALALSLPGEARALVDSALASKA